MDNLVQSHLIIQLIICISLCSLIIFKLNNELVVHHINFGMVKSGGFIPVAISTITRCEGKATGQRCKQLDKGAFAFNNL
jgi:hypothetical protein